MYIVKIIRNEKYMNKLFPSITNLECTPKGTCTPVWEPLP